MNEKLLEVIKGWDPRECSEEDIKVVIDSILSKVDPKDVLKEYDARVILDNVNVKNIYNEIFVYDFLDSIELDALCYYLQYHNIDMGKSILKQLNENIQSIIPDDTIKEEFHYRLPRLSKLDDIMDSLLETYTLDELRDKFNIIMENEIDRDWILENITEAEIKDWFGLFSKDEILITNPFVDRILPEI